MQDLAVEMIGWMRRRKLKHGESILVHQALDALDLAPSDRVTATRVLETLRLNGILDNAGARYVLTVDGFNRVYPETDAQCVQSVADDLVSYMAERSPSTAFQLAAYSTIMRSRLNPKEMEFVNYAIQKLEHDGFWTASGRGSYVLTQAGVARAS